MHKVELYGTSLNMIIIELAERVIIIILFVLPGLEISFTTSVVEI